MRIKIHTEEELVAAFKKLLHISVNMRHWQKEYGMHFGSSLRLKKNEWEERFDDFIEKSGGQYEQHNINKHR